MQIKVDVPQPFTCAPDDGSEVERRIMEFFEQIMNLLGYDTPQSRRVFTVENFALCRRTPGMDAHQTDDTVTRLIYHPGDHVVAVVTEMRNSNNFCVVIFGHGLVEDKLNLLRASHSRVDSKTPE